LIEISYDFVADICKIGIGAFEGFCKRSLQVCDGILDEFDCSFFSHVANRRRVRRFCYSGATIFSHINFYEEVYMFIEFFDEIIGCLVLCVAACLPVVEFQLIAKSEKKVNMLCGHGDWSPLLERTSKCVTIVRMFSQECRYLIRAWIVSIVEACIVTYVQHMVMQLLIVPIRSPGLFGVVCRREMCEMLF